MEGRKNAWSHEILYVQQHQNRLIYLRMDTSRCIELSRYSMAESKENKGRFCAQYNTIIFEKLNIGGMVKNHNLAQAIMEATWGKLRLITTYKVERCGGRVIIVNPNGTSQKCSNCGEVVKKDLSIRTHECRCGLVIDRDHYGALNILSLGMVQTFAEKQQILVQPKRISNFASRKQEAHVFRHG